MASHRESPIKRTNPSGDIRWVARYTGPDGKRRQAGTFKLKRQAQDAIDAAYDRPVVAQTVAAYLPVWQCTRPRSERTDRTNAGRIRNVLDLLIEGRRLGAWDMRELRRRHAAELVARMLEEQRRSAGGARNILRALSAMFEDAITDEFAVHNPWAGVKVRDDDRRAVKGAREPRVWSFEQMHAFAAAAGVRHEPLIRTMADCGLRIGEAFALQRAALEDEVLHISGSAWEGRIVESSGEKNHDRDVPVPPGCLAIIRAMPVTLHSPLLFPSPRGKLWRYSNFHRRIWQPTCEHVGMAPTPHDFRHSYVTHLRAAGIDVADLADVAGHSVETATSRYTHALRRSYDDIRSVVG